MIFAKPSDLDVKNCKTNNCAVFVRSRKCTLDAVDSGLASIVSKFTNCVDAFLTIAEHSPQARHEDAATTVDVEYMHDLVECVNTVRRTYFVPARRKVHVDYANLTLNVWGKVYWDFIHSTAILLQDAFFNKRIDHYYKFPAIVFNIDQILPCPMCHFHYQIIKHGTENNDILNKLCFGLLVYGTFKFHNLITKNIERSTKSKRPTLSDYSELDFALEYGCFPRSLLDRPFTYEYIPYRVVFHCGTHVKLTLLISLVYDTEYFNTSNSLMEFYTTHRRHCDANDVDDDNCSGDYTSTAQTTPAVAVKGLNYENLDSFREPVNKLINFKAVDYSDPAICRALEHCVEYKYPPAALKLRYFESVESLRPIVYYWMIATDCKPEETYAVRLNDSSSVVEIKNFAIVELETVGAADSL